jgi:hypothetical protein
MQAGQAVATTSQPEAFMLSRFRLPISEEIS